MANCCQREVALDGVNQSRGGLVKTAAIRESLTLSPIQQRQLGIYTRETRGESSWVKSWEKFGWLSRVGRSLQNWLGWVLVKLGQQSNCEAWLRRGLRSLAKVRSKGASCHHEGPSCSCLFWGKTHPLLPHDSSGIGRLLCCLLSFHFFETFLINESSGSSLNKTMSLVGWCRRSFPVWVPCLG